MNENQRELETGIETDLEGRLTYAGYLRLDLLLAAQQPRSRPPQHDEMLFVVQHQVSELWMKLMIHELRAAIGFLRRDQVWQTRKVIARCKAVMRQLIEQWSVLATLTPTEYVQFRDSLAKTSGFQSAHYRAVEFLLGNKNAKMLAVFAGEPENARMLREALETPSLYDEFLRLLARRGMPIPARILERDVTVAHVHDDELRDVLAGIYENAQDNWDLYEACEELVDLEENFQLWRFRHLRTVMRTIGFKRGTGGSSGVDFLRRALDLTFFPELFTVRTEIGAS